MRTFDESYSFCPWCGEEVGVIGDHTAPGMCYCDEDDVKDLSAIECEPTDLKGLPYVTCEGMDAIFAWPMDLENIENRYAAMHQDTEEPISPVMDKLYGKCNKAIAQGGGTICTASHDQKEQMKCSHYEINKRGNNCYWRIIGCDMCGNMKAQLEVNK